MSGQTGSAGSPTPGTQPVTGAAAPAPSQAGRPWLRRILNAAAVPFGAVILAFLVGSIMILLSSLSTQGSIDLTVPLTAYSSMLEGAGLYGDVNGLVNTLVQAVPLVLGGLAVGVGFKAGLFNIGATGQILVGAIAAAGTGAAVAQWPAPAAITVSVLAGALAGAAWGFIPGALKAWTGAHEVVTTIMLNTIAASLMSYLVSGPLLAPGYSFDRTGDIGNAVLPVLFGRNLHAGVLLAIVAVPAIWWLLWRSTLGFEIRTVGANPSAARYAGMRPGLITILTMSLCGLLAGLAGANEILGSIHFVNAGYSTAVGFDAITVALLGRAHPLGITVAALLFGAMRAGANLMQINTGIPVEIVDILQAVVLLFVAADVIVRRLLRIRAAGAGITELQTITKSYGEQSAV
jgi:general nucleoside transport system permease protein